MTTKEREIVIQFTDDQQIESIGQKEKTTENKYFETVNQRVAGSSPAAGASK